MTVVPNPEHMVAVAHADIGGFASGDLDAVVALFADEPTVEDPVGSPPQWGSAAIREFYAGGLGSAKLELLREPRCAADHVAFPFRARAEAAGGTTQIEAINTFRFGTDGKIAEVRAFWGPDNIKIF